MSEFPIAKKGLRKLQKELPSDRSAQPSQDQITALVDLYSSRQMTETEQACRELLQSYPQSSVVTNILGAVLRDQGKLREALENFDKAIQLKPDFAEAHNNRGIVLEQLGQPDEALTSCNKAIQLEPDNAWAFYNRGIALRALGQLDEALDSYDKAIQLEPDNAEAYRTAQLYN